LNRFARVLKEYAASWQPITEEFAAHVGPTLRGVLLSLIELVWQANGGNEETCRYIVGLAKSVANESPGYRDVVRNLEDS
jgi:hypothetical protein